MRISSFCASVPIPIYFFPYTDLPVIEVEIESEKYLLELDMGCDDLVLQAPLLKDCVKLGSVKTSDITGNIYSSSEYLLSKMRIQSLEFKDVVVRKENLNFLTEGCIISPAANSAVDRLSERLKNIQGRIGWNLFKGKKWYFNFSKSLLVLIDDKKDLDDRFISANSAEIPFETSKIGIILCVNTDLGKKNFLLDTGANHFFIRQSLVEKRKAKQIGSGKYIYLSKITINDLSLGVYPFFLFDCAPLYEEIDGVLGVQFFECNDLYLDFNNKRAVIGPKQQGLWESIAARIREFFWWFQYNVF